MIATIDAVIEQLTVLLEYFNLELGSNFVFQYFYQLEKIRYTVR